MLHMIYNNRENISIVVDCLSNGNSESLWEIIYTFTKWVEESEKGIMHVYCSVAVYVVYITEKGVL